MEVWNWVYLEKLKLPFKLAGNPIEPSDLRMRLDVAVRDNKTITRKIVEIRICLLQAKEQ